MIIDADTHISPVVSPKTIQTQELIRQMDLSGVDRAVCWLQPPYLREIDESLRYVYDATRRHPDRLLGFGWADPHLGLKKSVDTIRRCVEEYGFYGVKLNGAQNEFYIDDEELSLPLIEEIAKTGKPLALHIGADAYDYTHPYRAAKIARRYPQMPILMVHMGGAGTPDVSAACIEAAREHPNMTLVGSNIGLGRVAAAIRALGAGRVCFGSDTPFSPMHADLCAYQALLQDDFTPREARMVLGENIARLLGLRGEIAQDALTIKEDAYAGSC